MFGFKKEKRYNIDVKTADQMLQNVFAACDTAPNRVPFDKIVLRSKQNLRSDNFLIILSIVIFAITFFCPLFFPHSKAFVSVNYAEGRPLNVQSSEMTDTTFSITFDGSMLDPGKSFMQGSDDAIVYPSEYDRDTNTLTFPYVPKEYNIYVYDVDGRCIHLLLTPHK